MLLDFDELYKKYNMNIKGVLHIGAHFGQEVEIYEKYYIKNIIFFEPVPVTFERLKNNIGERAILVNKALGNDNKIVNMYIEESNAGQSSSVLRPIEHLNLFPWVIFNKKIDVEMIRLDDFLLNKNEYNFINIDVQGYELEVFKGSEETLNNIDYIITEVNRIEVYNDCVRIEQLDNYLNTYGFERVETKWFDAGWGDAFYIKNKI